MKIEAQIWTPDPEDNDGDGDGDTRDGDLLIESVGEERVQVAFLIDGDMVASAILDSFTAGVITGALSMGAEV